MSNSAGVSLLLARFLTTPEVRAAAGQSSDGQFSWMDGLAEELDGETLSELMAGALAGADELPWEEPLAGLQRTSFDFDEESLILYLVSPDFLVAAVAPTSTDFNVIDGAVNEIIPDLRGFI